MSREKALIIIFVVALAFALVLPTSGHAVTETGGGKILKYKSVTSDDHATSTSEVNSLLPGMERTVKLNRRGRMVITLTAYSYCQGTSQMFVTARVNGADVSPGEVQFAGAGVPQGMTRAMTWVTDKLDPGAYTVDMQYRSASNGQGVYMRMRTLLIEYYK